ncbi:MAG: 2-C-methyl-D-erythritol 4-phosphate cytidylyltransferase [Endomicrobiia bacterium]|nr:2-C-methyl-D-erythritol 4-phosphate cytidylyltransferase [Endomicrobiia bacterium]
MTRQAIAKSKKNVSAIVVAAGRGKRFGSIKQFVELGGKPVYMWSVDALAMLPQVREVIVAVPRGLSDSIRLKYPRGGKIKYVAGGKERCDSVRIALAAASRDTEIILVHDAARPLVSKKIILAAIRAAALGGAAIAAVPATDTVKISADGKLVSRTVPRSSVFLAQTPQVFRREIIMKAYEKPDPSATDDSYLVENSGVQPVLVAGSYENFKITSPRDLDAAETILNARRKIKFPDIKKKIK